MMDTIRHLQVIPASTHKHANTLPFCEGLEHFYDAGSNAPWTPGEKKTHCNEAKVVRHFRS